MNRNEIVPIVPKPVGKRMNRKEIVPIRPKSATKEPGTITVKIGFGVTMYPKSKKQEEEWRKTSKKTRGIFRWKILIAKILIWSALAFVVFSGLVAYGVI